MTAPLEVLQITDTHLKAPGPASAASGRTLLGVDTADSLRAVLDQALRERTPDAVIASGDLAHDPEDATYRRFADLLGQRFQGPLLQLPGNHDLAEPMARVLGSRRSLALGQWMLIGFDTHADHQTEASFDEARRRELMASIEACDAEHVLLACHHHPRAVGCPWLDKDVIVAGHELVASWAELRNGSGAAPVVRALVFGHVHQEVRGVVSGVQLWGTPSTCFQFRPRSQRFAIDDAEASGRPGYRWLSLHPDGTVQSQVGRLKDYPLNIDLSNRS